MDAKILTESGWKATAAKFKVKDNGLQKALATYEKIQQDKHEERLKGILQVSQLASTLKKNKDVAELPEVIKYLASLASTAEDEKNEIIKAKALAAKNAAIAQKKAGADAKSQEEEAEEEEEQGDYKVKLLAAFNKLKSSKGLAYQFLVCDAKPFCGLVLAKRISSKHKAELTELTGGSKRFLHPGICQFEDGHFVFSMDQPITGLARKLQLSVKNFTGKKFPIVLGSETAEDDEEQAATGAPAQPGAAKREPPALAKAPEAWKQTRSGIEAILAQIKAAVRKDLAGEGPEVLGEIDKNMTRLDGILDKLDHRLADSMAKAHAAKDLTARQAELKNSKTILADYLKYLKSEEPLLAHLDANPFGIKCNLKQTLTDRMRNIALALA